MVTGGQYDVDVTLEGPKGDVIYRQIKTQFDSHQFTASVSLSICVVFACDIYFAYVLNVCDMTCSIKRRIQMNFFCGIYQNINIH